MKAEGGDHSMINLSVQQVLSLWAHGTVLRNLTEMWYWIFLWALFSSLFVHGAAGVLMFVMLQRHRQGRVISLIAVSIGFLASVTGAMITRSSPRSEPRGQGLLHRRRPMYRCSEGGVVGSWAAGGEASRCVRRPPPAVRCCTTACTLRASPRAGAAWGPGTRGPGAGPGRSCELPADALLRTVLPQRRVGLGTRDVRRRS
ncbi:transmembrane protein 170B isoform X1 [Canis lupus familiaris]|uniref:transmembrane protein 170B isoform X1 n=1 Tax=Canis lupus familiaris TaxID=9615 RepID=UPI0006B3C40B|nr:transmembrane protein 170B isoform X1 [Canis lupus familiaris]XP_025300189.2 transmembrane protein 170B isoform X1 [Canis lupus dingo]XP_038302310.1 transmembrane protein 170B isoform X1 [Canis lupus familiaris]